MMKLKIIITRIGRVNYLMFIKFTVILQEICDAFPDRTLAEEEEAVRYLNSKLRDDTVLNLKALFLSRVTRVKYEDTHCGGTCDDDKESQNFVAYNSAKTDEHLSIVPVNIQDSRNIVSNKSREIPKNLSVICLRLRTDSLSPIVK